MYKVLNSLDISKATGPDGISNRLLKEASVPIAEPLSHLLNFSLSLGTFPDDWKLTNVIPIFKKGDSMLCTNYCPISLLCCVSKVFEKIIFDHIYAYLKCHGILSKNQSGFIQGDSTINQLISICNLLYKGLDNGDEFIGVFLDLTKAFDKVWHTGLIFKIKKYGIKGNLLKWLTSYLTNRKQKVVINGNSSDIKDLQAGVPQGSVLGPLLFLLYINDFCKNVSSKDFMFADDTSLFKKINNNIHHAASVVNKDLEGMHNWCKQWLVMVNPTKTVYMLFSRKISPSQIPPILYGNIRLQQVYEHKHLGLIFTPNIS